MLENINVEDSTWKTLVAHLREEKGRYQDQLCAPNQEERSSDFLRGKIALINELLRVSTPDKQEQEKLNPPTDMYFD